jgi:hypothetical protein
VSIRIVGESGAYGPASFVEPTTLGYLHIAARVNPSRAPFLPNGRPKTSLLHRLGPLSAEVERLDPVERSTVFHAWGHPPFGRLPYVKDRPGRVRLADFDVVVLVETKSVEATRRVQDEAPYRELLGELQSAAHESHVIAARNIKRIADVDRRKKGIFLFNYFVADERDVMLELWDHLAGWYRAETGLDNSELLVPLEGERSDFVAINYARWDGGPLRFLFNQLSKKSFRSYLLANLEENRVGSMPVLYRRIFGH